MYLKNEKKIASVLENTQVRLDSVLSRNMSRWLAGRMASIDSVRPLVTLQSI